MLVFSEKNSSRYNGSRMESWQKKHITDNLSKLAYATNLNAYVLTGMVTEGLLDIQDVLHLVS